ncbi:MAG: thioredoxin domain-containing protein, partial [Caldicoprobacter sp.]|uniref:thioredoxin domain-containing protein n=1 Tax=Caldicoprobacter sp. TaxID=2004500 RepID=UPI0039C0C31F
AQAWRTNRQGLIESGNKIVEVLQDQFTLDSRENDLTKEDVHEAYRGLERSFDPVYGGFGTAPKFPIPHNLYFLMRYWKMTGEQKALEMVEKTLDAMYRGGIFDHIGYGFSRYSTDRKWLVPHFEKMLYDNALLAIAYLEAYLCTKKDVYAEVAKKIFTYVLRDMALPEGGFYSAEDADSEGEEGKFYLWTPNEIKDILGEREGEMFCDYYGITDEGNFEGRSIPTRIHTSAPVNEDEALIAPLRQRVFMRREQRVHPFKDDKILTSWNGLMIAAMAMGGRVLQDQRYIQSAERAAEFVFHKLVDKNGRLMARYRHGETAYPAYLDDYAYLIWGLIELYEATYKPVYLQYAIRENQRMIDLFWDPDRGGFFLYGRDGEQLIARPKEVYDGALPSGNSVAAMNLLRLARLTGKQDLEDMAIRQLKAFAGIVKQFPAAHTYFMMAAMFALYPTREIVFAGSKGNRDLVDMINAFNSAFAPNTVTLLHSDDEEGRQLEQIVPYVKDQKAVDGRATAYVCENFACRAPIVDKNELLKMLN